MTTARGGEIATVAKVIAVTRACVVEIAIANVIERTRVQCRAVSLVADQARARVRKKKKKEIVPNLRNVSGIRASMRKRAPAQIRRLLSNINSLIDKEQITNGNAEKPQVQEPAKPNED